MFAYNHQPNRFGENLAAGYMSAANSQANAITQEAAIRAAMDAERGQMIGDGITAIGDKAKKVAAFLVGGPAGAAMASDGGGGLLDTFIGAYAKKEQDKADSKIYGNLMKIVAPAFGKDGDSLLEQWNSLESDSDRASFGSSLLGSLGTISNMYMAKGRMGIQQQGQQIQQNAPFVNAGIQGAKDRASGNKTFTGGGTAPSPADVASTEPPLPPFSPGAGAAPAPTPAASMPGGAQSKEALNRWLRSQGRPEIP
jgi:hypothetical protein